MTEEKKSTPGWMWILGAVVILALVLGTLRIIDAIFSPLTLVLAILGVAGYLWYRNSQKSKV
jgi:hypothetical protein